MTRQAVYTGFITGIIVLLVLIYPLYVAWPGTFFEGWTPGSPTLALGLEIAAGLLIAGGGYIAARRAGANTRTHGLLLGALAGAIAGLVVFAGLGAAAAATSGMEGILQHGPTPAGLTPSDPAQPVDDAQFLTLLATAVSNIVWNSHLTLWAMLIGGGLLGGVGGLIAPLTEYASPAVADSAVGDVLAFVAVVSSLLSLVVTAAIFALLPESVQNVAEQNPAVILPATAQWLLVFPVATVFAFALASAMWLVARLQGARRSNDGASLRRAAVLGILGGALSILVGLFLLVARLSEHWLLIAVAGGLIGIGGVIAWLGFVASRAARVAEPDRPRAPVWYIPAIILYFIAAGMILGAVGTAIAAPLLHNTIPGGYYLNIVINQWLLPLLAAIGLVVLLPTLHRLAKLPPPALDDVASLINQNVPVLALGLASVLFVPGLGLLAAALGNVLGPVVAIEILSHFGPGADPSFTATWTSASLTQSLYTTIGPILLGFWIGAAILVALALVILAAVMRWTAARSRTHLQTASS